MSPTYEYHPHLTGRGIPSANTCPQAPPNPPKAAENPWNPFNSYVEFDFVHYQFVEVQNSAPLIDKALDLWAATVMEFGGNAPWSNTMELYATIDTIQQGDSPWKDEIANNESTHGAMFVPVITGSDKTTVSIATGHQEYHPVYMSPGNLTNIAQRAHGNALLPIAFLPIPKTQVFQLLKAGMTTPEVVRCPDGHFRRAIYGLGPYIADYPKQVWLAAIVQGWCPKGCPSVEPKKTEYLINCWDPGTLWTNSGVCADIVLSEHKLQPFTSNFPRANIHDYYHQISSINVTPCISISAVPAFPGLQCFLDGHDFTQWTGDDSKVLMKVYLAAIASHVPSEVVKCLSTFLDFCQITCCNAIISDTLDKLQDTLNRFHYYQQFFIGTTDNILSFIISNPFVFLGLRMNSAPQ
ncbi:hypothetical protein BJV74DRAFT_794985 [Russula compacta]|nr:hypothetical protein BJV74DRAFT_794985 [Russula compacta]